MPFIFWGALGRPTIDAALSPPNLLFNLDVVVEEKSRG